MHTRTNNSISLWTVLGRERGDGALAKVEAISAQCTGHEKKRGDMSI